MLYDLLDPSSGRGLNKKKADSHIDIKEHPVLARPTHSAPPTPCAFPRRTADPAHRVCVAQVLGVYVQGLQEIPVDNHEKIEKLMDQGNATRAVASTQMNATSSRSRPPAISRDLHRIFLGGPLLHRHP